MSKSFQQYYICLFPEIYTILGQKRTAIVLLSFRRRYFTMGIVKIYNVLGGFYSYYSITLASESVNKHAQVFDYFCAVLLIKICCPEFEPSDVFH